MLLSLCLSVSLPFSVFLTDSSDLTCPALCLVCAVSFSVDAWGAIRYFIVHPFRPLLLGLSNLQATFFECTIALVVAPFPLSFDHPHGSLPAEVGGKPYIPPHIVETQGGCESKEGHRMVGGIEVRGTANPGLCCAVLKSSRINHFADSSRSSIYGFLVC